MASTEQTPKRKFRNWQPTFLDVLSKTLSVTKACEACHLHRTYAYQVRAKNPIFAQAWDDALQQAIELAEAEMYRRAVTGIDKPITVAQQREVIKEYSDTLLIFMLKAHKSSLYRERVQVDTWRDRVIDGLRSGKLKAETVKHELGIDLATELFIAAGVQLSNRREDVEIEQDDTDSSDQ